MKPAATVGELIELLKAYPPDTKVEGYWEGITRAVLDVRFVPKRNVVQIDVDDSPSTWDEE